MKAFKLININETESSFLEGTVPELQHIQVDYFFLHAHIEPYERVAHPSPRYQFVLTLKGKLRFTVTNGNTFIIEPGVLLIADDLKGPGHTWELIEGTEWHRAYIVLQGDDPDFFLPDKTT